MPESQIDPDLGLSYGGLEALSRAASIFMEVKGQKSGPIHGDSDHKGTEKQIAVQILNHSIVSPRDAASGLPTGKRNHHAIEVAVKLDRSAPLLVQALCTNENLQEVKIHCWGAASKAAKTGIGSGTTELYTIQLTNAQLSKFVHFTAADGTLCYLAAYTYQKITWTWKNGGLMGEDDWLSPMV
jgi:type VI secretion system secreted protein Hcp